MSAVTDDAMTYFTGRGLKHHQAAAIVGGLMQESGPDINPTLSHDNGTGYGVAGFRDPAPGQGRWTNLKRFASENGLDVSHRRTQYAFIMHELDGDERSAGNALRAATDVTSAAEAFMGYERPQGYSAATPRNGHGWVNRLNNAATLAGAPIGAAAPVPEPEGTQLFDGSNPYQGMSTETPLTPEDRYQRDDPSTPYASVWQDVEASAKSDWLIPWALREIGRGAEDPNYEMPPERFNQLTKELPEQFHEYVLDSHSEADEMSRIKWAQDQMLRDSKLAAGGMGSLGLRLLTNVVDPTFVLTGGAVAAAAPILGAAKLSRFGRLLYEGAATGLAEGVATAATDVVNPTIDESDVWASFGLGAVLGGTLGALRKNKYTQAEADAMAAMGRTLMAPTATPTPVGSVGAAVNPNFKAPFMASTPILDDADITGSAMAGARFDSVGQAGSSDAALSRLVAPHMGEEAIGNKDHSAVADAATTVQKLIDGKYVASWQSVAYPAFKKFAQETGQWKRGKRTTAWRDFNEQITDYVEEVSPAAGRNEHVVRAAGEFRRVMREYSELMANPRRDVGATGRPIADITPDPNYVAKYGDHEAIHDIHNKFDQPALLQFLEDAIYKRASTMAPEIAKRIAKGWLANITKAGYGIEDGVSMAVSRGDKEALKEMLQERIDGKINLLLSDDDVNHVMDQIDGMGKKDGDSGFSRTRRRTLFDYAHKGQVRGKDGQFHDISMRDFFVKDADMIMRRYSRQTSGRVSLAQLQVRHPKTKELIIDGIVSRSEFEKLLNHIRDSWSQKSATMGQAEIEAGIHQDTENFKYLYDAITGTPHYNPRNQVYQWMRRLREFNFVRLMNRMGMAQSQEAARMIGTLGFKAVFSQVPAVRKIVDSAGRNIPRDDRLLQELHARTGMGSSRWLDSYQQAYGGKNLDVDVASVQSYKEQKFGRTARVIDKGLEQGKRITANISLMKHIHGIQKDWTMKAVSQRLYDMARKTEVPGGHDLTKLKGSDQSRLRGIGMTDEDMIAVFKEMRKHGTTTKGSRLDELKLDQWDPMVEGRFIKSLARWSDRIIHENDAGTMNRWMSQPIVQMMTQFRAFIIGSWAKSTLYNIHNFDARTFATMMLEVMAGASTWALTQGIANAGDPDKLVEKFTLKNLAQAGFGRAAWGSLVPAAVDSAVAFSPIEAPFGGVRTSGTPTDAFFGNPAADMITNMATFTKGLANSAIQGEPLSQQTINAGARNLPFSNFLPFSAVLGAMIKDQPKYTPRLD